MTEEISYRIKQSLGWSSSIRILVQVFAFVTSIIIARILDPRDFGIMAMGLIVISYSNSITNFGFNNALVQKERITKSHIDSVFTIDISISLLLTVLTFVSAGYIADFFGTPESANVLRILSSVFLLTTFVDMQKMFLKRSVNFKFLALLGLLETIFKSLLAIILAVLGFQYWALVWSHIAPMFLVGIILLATTNWRPSISYNHQEMKSIYGFGAWNFLRAQIYYINRYVMHFLVGRSLGAVYLGYFDKAFTLGNSPTDALALPINAVMFSGFSRLQNDKARLRQWFKNLLILQSSIIVPFAIGLSLIASHFVIVLLGEKWRLTIIPLQILCIATIFNTFNGGIASFNIAVGNYKRHTLFAAISSIILFFLTVVFLKWGLNGVCYSFLFVSFIWFLLILRLAIKFIAISMLQCLRWVSHYLVANLIMLAVVKVLASTLLLDATPFNLILLITIGALTHCLSILIINLLKGNSILFPLGLMFQRAKV